MAAPHAETRQPFTLPLRTLLALGFALAMGAGALAAIAGAVSTWGGAAEGLAGMVLSRTVALNRHAAVAAIRSDYELGRVVALVESGVLDVRAAHDARALVFQGMPASNAAAITLVRASEGLYRIERNGSGRYLRAVESGASDLRVREDRWDSVGAVETRFIPRRDADPIAAVWDDPLVSRAARALEAAGQSAGARPPRTAVESLPATTGGTARGRVAAVCTDPAGVAHAFVVEFENDYSTVALHAAAPFASHCVAMVAPTGEVAAERCLSEGGRTADAVRTAIRARAGAPIEGGSDWPLLETFQGEDGVGVWIMRARLDAPGSGELQIVAAVAQHDITWALIAPVMATLPGWLLALVLGLAVAFGAPRSALRTIRVAVAKSQRIGRQGVAPGYWPRTRVREFAALRRVLEGQLAAPAPSVRAVPIGAGETPAAAAGPEPAMPAARMVPGDAQELSQPPHAYVQALQTTRRQLRDLQAELDEVYLELQEVGARDQAVRARLEAQRGALAGLAAGGGIDGADDLAAFHEMAEAGTRALGVQRVRVWRWDEPSQALAGALRYEAASGEAAPGAGLPRAACSMLFLALESMPALAVRDIAADPRTRAYAELLDDALPARAALIVPVRRGMQLAGAVAFEQMAEERHWEPDEQNLALGLAGLVAHRFSPLLLPAPEADPPPTPVLLRKPVDGEAARSPLEDAAGLLWTCDREGRFTWLNAAAMRAYGWQPDALAGRYVTEFCAPGFAQLERLALRAVVGGQPRYSYLTEHLRAGGGTMPLAVNLAPRRDAAGAVCGAVAVAADLGEAHLRGAAADPIAHFREAVAGSHELIFEIDSIGVIQSVNPAVARVLGHLPDDVVGRPIARFAAAHEQAQADLARLAALLDGAECEPYRTTCFRKDGTPVRLLVVAEAQRGGDGRVAGALCAAIELA